MKKFRIIGVILCVVLMVLCFTRCGNMSLGLGNFEYNKVHVDTYHFSGCLEVEKWYEQTTGIEVELDNGENIFLSEGTYTLIEDNCPFCEGSVVNEK